MSHAESPRHGLRSSASINSLLSTAALQHHQQYTDALAGGVHSWDDYHTAATTPLEDHLGEFMDQNRFKEQYSASDTSADYRGLGLDMDVDMAGVAALDEEEAFYDDGEAPHLREGGEGSGRALTRLQSRSTKSQVGHSVGSFILL
ncbi:hypothetical protein P7C70_g8947, partial [Phenoliferia sp. Uapishka_3]